MSNFEHKKIERKWQKKWEKEGLYKTKEDKKRPKYYILDMFPYPSGAGLHVGHPKGYIATDIFARMRSMQGYNVLHPMGWDAFGLPAENFALKNKVHPKTATDKNIETFKSQLKKLGFTYDWEREINTTDPKFYKWTQWIFLELFKRGLAYESHEPIIWCPSCKTGLSNEDLEGGKCERCGSEVERKPMRQWVLRITAYAERMLEDLKKLPDWEESIKEMQKNWIGRSEGARVKFKIVSKTTDNRKQIMDNDTVEVFTTRPDTLFGATYFVLAPEHEIILKNKDKILNIDEVKNYIKRSAAKSELERTDLAKDKTGVRLEGLVAINPVNQEEIPIFVADYVLMGYGTGAIMAVPAHDERDFEFARKYGLPIREVVVPETGTKTADAIEKRGGCGVIFDPETQKYAVAKRQNGFYGLYAGGANNGESLHDCVVREVGEESGFNNFIHIEEIGQAYTNYYNSLKDHRVCGRALCLLFILENRKQLPLQLEEHEKFELEWVSADEIAKNWEKHDHSDGGLDHWKFFLKKAVSKAIELGHDKTSDRDVFKTEAFSGSGRAVNSGFLDDLTTGEAKSRMIDWLKENDLGEKAVSYKIKDWVFSRQRYWGEPFPLIFCEHCREEVLGLWQEQGADVESADPAEIANFDYSVFKNCRFNIGELMNPGWVEEPELPLKLPEVESYEPSGTGESPLANMDEWLNTACPKCGGRAKRETNTMPQWAGSSWYYLRYIDPDNEKALVDKGKDLYWSPVDFYVGGAEHATRHLIYARFWHKFLYDIGAVNYDEPFMRLQHVGLIMAEDGRKMSKRWANVINPDEVVEKYGADAMRVYEMFMGPFSQAVAWSTNGLVGARKFLDRVWRLRERMDASAAGEKEAKIEKLLHKTIKKVGEDIEEFRFNTAVSALMILLNEIEKAPKISKQQYSTLLLLLAPFAPHLAEELWAGLDKREESIFKQSWPAYDKNLMKDDVVRLAVQVNGKLRDTIELEADVSEQDAISTALAGEKIKKWTEDKEIVKTIYIKGKLVSIVAK